MLEGTQYCYNCFQKLTSEGPCPHCGFDRSQMTGNYPAALPCGTVLGGKYIVGRVLGQGGFDITYKAFDPVLELSVAVKEYLPDTMATRSPSTTQVTIYTGTTQYDFDYGVSCFLDEARTLAKLSSGREVVPVRNFFEENGTAYFVMDYVEGISFKAYIQNHGGKIPLPDALRIMLPVMDGLSYVHGSGIIHRDVTPDNIYITKNDEIKLLDFGSARYSMGDRSKSLDVILKPGFAPKEQYMRRGRQGPYTDVYSVAACLYAAITGFLPPESLERMEKDMLAMPSALGIAIPPALEQAIVKGLAVQQEERFQTMAEFKAALLAAAPAPAAPAAPAFPQPGVTRPVSPPPVFTPTLRGAPKTVPAAAASPKTGYHPSETGPASVFPPEQESLPVGEQRLSKGKIIAICAGAAAAVVLLAVVGLNLLRNTNALPTAGTVDSSALSAQQPGSSTVSHEIPELFLTLTLPKDTFIFTPDTPEDDPLWKEAGLEERALIKILYSTEPPLRHFSADNGKTNVFVIQSRSNPLFEDVYNLSDLPRKELDALVKNLQAQYAGALEGLYQKWSVDIYESAGITYLKTGVEMDGSTLSEGLISEITYFTVINGMTVNFDQFLSGGELKDMDTTLLEQLMGSARFQAVDEAATKQASSSPLAVKGKPIQTVFNTFFLAVLHEGGTVSLTPAYGLSAKALQEVEQWTDIVQLTHVRSGLFGLRADGTVVSAFVPDVDEGRALFDVSSWTDMVQLASSDTHLMGLRTDGTVAATGRNDEGQCAVEGFKDVEQIAAGESISACMTAGGTLIQFVGTPSTKFRISNAPYDLKSFIARNNLIMGIDRENRAVVLGDSSAYQDMNAWNRIVKLLPAGRIYFGLKDDGTVVSHTSSDEFTEQTEAVREWRDVVDISTAGQGSLIGLKADGTLYSLPVLEGQLDYTPMVEAWNKTVPETWDAATRPEPLKLT